MILETRRLSKQYGSHVALRDLDLGVESGEVFGFLGPNGAGKSTTIRILLGLIRSSSGSATILGRDAWRDGTAIRDEVGYLPGDVRFPESSTGRQVVDLLGALRRRPCRHDELADRLELDLDRPVRAYSKGMKQKLGLVQALMHDPRLVILDEPTSGLDPLTQRTVERLLRETRQRGATVFFSSHVLPEVEGICDRVALLRGGRLLRCGALDEMAELRLRRFELTLPTGEQARSLAAELRGAGIEARSDRRRVVGGTDRTNLLLEHLRPHDASTLKLEGLRLEDLFHRLYGDASQEAGEDGVTALEQAS